MTRIEPVPYEIQVDRHRPDTSEIYFSTKSDLWPCSYLQLSILCAKH